MTKIEDIEKLVKFNRYDLNKIAREVNRIEGTIISPEDDGLFISVFSSNYHRYLGGVKVRRSHNPNACFWYVEKGGRYEKK